MGHPYGMCPSDRDVLEAVKDTQGAYKHLGEAQNQDLPDLGKCGPAMYYCEFLSVRHYYIDKLSRPERLDLTVECIRRYLETANAPACSLFDKGKAYDCRPIECRIVKGTDKDMVFSALAELRSIDRALGMPRKMQDTKCGTLTYQDWHLMFEMSVPWLRNLTPLRQKLEDEKKEQFVEALKNALKAAEEDDEDEGEGNEA